MKGKANWPRNGHRGIDLTDIPTVDITEYQIKTWCAHNVDGEAYKIPYEEDDHVTGFDVRVQTTLTTHGAMVAALRIAIRAIEASEPQHIQNTTYT